MRLNKLVPHRPLQGFSQRHGRYKTGFGYGSIKHREQNFLTLIELMANFLPVIAAKASKHLPMA